MCTWCSQSLKWQETHCSCCILTWARSDIELGGWQGKVPDNKLLVLYRWRGSDFQMSKCKRNHDGFCGREMLICCASRRRGHINTFDTNVNEEMLVALKQIGISASTVWHNLEMIVCWMILSARWQWVWAPPSTGILSSCQCAPRGAPQPKAIKPPRG